MINFWKDQSPPSDTSKIWIRLNENKQVVGYFRYEDGQWIILPCGGLKRYIIDKGHQELVDSIVGDAIEDLDTLGEIIIELSRKVYTADLARVAFTGDYADLLNYPIISNNIELDKDSETKIASVKAIYEAIGIKYGTTSYWNEQVGYIPPKREIIIYSDYAHKQKQIEVDGELVTVTIDIPGVKIGTGNAYVQDLAFVGEYEADLLYAHLLDDDRHLRPGERERWNNKLNVDDDSEVVEDTLIFNRN